MPAPFLLCNKYILSTPRFSISTYPGHPHDEYVKRLIAIMETGSG
jgi:hypothetical protein